MQTKRIGWIDGVRSLAMGWILIVHFISIFTINTHARFPGVLGLILYGISGKLAVACFCVLLGYFASKPSNESILGYAVRRYLFFAVQILVIELVYYGLVRILPDYYLCVFAPWMYNEPSTLLISILKDAFLFKASVLPTLWCVDDFIIGSVAVFAVSKLLRNQNYLVRLLSCIALFSIGLIVNHLWAALCVLGYLLRLTDDITVPTKISIPLSIILLCLIPWMIRRGENDLTHLLDGVACLCLLWTIGQFSWMQRIMSWRPLTLLGSYTFELFLLHVPVFHIIETLFHCWQIQRPPQPVYYLYFILVLPFTVLCAILWRKLADRTLNPLLRRISRSLP